MKIGDHDDPGHMSKTETTAEDAKYLRGTLFYMSPELIGKPSKGIVGRKTDIWSLGYVLLRMSLKGDEMQFSQPGSEIEDESTFVTYFDFNRFMLCDGQPVVPCSLNDDLSGIIRDCLQHSQDERPTANQLVILHEKQLALASSNFVMLTESKVVFTFDWKKKANSSVKSLPKPY